MSELFSSLIPADEIRSAKTIGFSNKFPLKVGDSFKFVGDEKLFQEPTNLTYQNQKVYTPFYAWQNADGTVAKRLSAGALNKGRVPTNLDKMSLKPLEGVAAPEQLISDPILMTDIPAKFAGKTLTVIGLQEYSGYSETLDQTLRSKVIHWSIS